MNTVLIIIAVTALMILLNALYVAAEFATVSARRVRISQQAAGGNRLARLLEPILADTHRLDNYVAACQLGITASSLVLGFYGQSAIASTISPLLSRLGRLQEIAAQSLSATLVLIVLTLLQVVLGELLPKSVAIRYPERMALLTVVPLRWSMWFFRPAIALFNGTGTLILRLLRVPAAGHHTHIHSPDEIKLLVGESTKGGLLDQDEYQLLSNVFRVGDLTAAQVMVPRNYLIAAPVTTPLKDLLELAVTSGHTRIPLYDKTIDNILGIVHLKDLFRLHATEQNEVGTILRTVPFVPESNSAAEVWNQLRQEKSYVAVVFDEFGGTAGLITIEDLIEEIFGDLQDESDQEADWISTNPDGSVCVNGQTLIGDVNEQFGLQLPEENVNTIGGLVIDSLGRVPQVGDTVTIAGVTFRVETVSGPAVREVSFTPPPATVDPVDETT